MKANNITVLIALIAIIGTFTSIMSQEAFADGPDPIPAGCALDPSVIPGGANDNRLTNTNTHSVSVIIAASSAQVTYTEISPPVGGAASQLAQFVLDGSVTNVPIIVVGGVAVHTFTGLGFGPHTVQVCAGDTADQTTLNSLEHIDSIQFETAAICPNGIQEGAEECDNGLGNSDITPDACRTDCTLPSCGDGVVDPSNNEQCEPSTAPPGICGPDCRFIIGSSGEATGTTDIEPLCGLKRVVSTDDQTEDNSALLLGTTVNNQVTPSNDDPGTPAFFVNTGAGPGEVGLTQPVENWVDSTLAPLSGFSGCNTWWGVFANTFYSGMTSVCDATNPYIDVLPGVGDPNPVVTRYHRVLAGDVADNIAANAGNPVTFTQVLEATVDCEEPATCPINHRATNGECFPIGD